MNKANHNHITPVLSIRRIVLLIVAWILCAGAYPQINVKEHISMHLSHDQLITGETLYYSANVVSSFTNKYSPLSEILYLEIINNKGEAVFQVKNYVNDGKAYGDLFIPSLISTGMYHLIAYTRWMKNFGDYYHHPIQIINPFEKYEIPEATKDLKVDFYPEGGHLVKGQTNRVVALVTNYLNEAQQIDGRLVDGEGNILMTVKSDELGLISFEFTPQAASSYQLILEDKLSDFQFFKLPGSDDRNYSLRVNTNPNSLEVKVLGHPDKEAIAQVRMYHRTDEIWSREMQVNQSVAISLKDLPKGANLIVAEIENQKVSERITFILPENLTENTDSEGIFEPRSLASIPLKVDQPAVISISVRKCFENRSAGMYFRDLLYGIDDLSIFRDQYLYEKEYEETLDRLMIASKWKFALINKSTEIALLPDHRGEIVSGKLDLPDSVPLYDNKVAYSVIGKDYQVRAAVSDSLGHFSMITTPFEEDRKAFITSLNGFDAEWIDLDDQFLENYPPLTFRESFLDTTELRYIVERSIRNQIENAYYELHEDSVIRRVAYPEEFGRFVSFYTLDNFNRFPTIRDSFVEYIPTVAARKRDEHYEFKVSPKYYLADPELESMAFLDGLPVDSDEILSFSPYRIESIGVINNRYFWGPLILDGIISFRTKQGDLYGFKPGANSRPLEYLGVSPLKVYTFPLHKDSNLGEANLSSRIPDYRDQLFWAPEVKIDPDEAYNLQFFTSDTQGEFEVVLEGISPSGEPVMITRYFDVK